MALNNNLLHSHGTKPTPRSLLTEISFVGLWEIRISSGRILRVHLRRDGSCAGVVWPGFRRVSDDFVGEWAFNNHTRMLQIHIMVEGVTSYSNDIWLQASQRQSLYGTGSDGCTYRFKKIKRSA